MGGAQENGTGVPARGEFTVGDDGVVVVVGAGGAIVDGGLVDRGVVVVGEAAVVVVVEDDVVVVDDELVVGFANAADWEGEAATAAAMVPLEEPPTTADTASATRQASRRPA